jgi:transcriptional regulator with PAS, ATPase and Fis domain
MSEKRFRQDLLYRINTVELNLPPLRKRAGDIPLLIQHFLQIYSKKYNKPVKQISNTAFDKLKNYFWPGNIRELQHTIERVIIMSESETLQPGDFYFPSNDSKVNENEPVNYHLEEAEKLMIIKAVSKHGGNLTKAAKELGLTRASLYRRLEKYGL